METQMKQRVFTGVVTQLQDHHGIVDQEVHFQMSVVIGRVPLVGEKVLVKAVLDPSQSISWTAQRVQTLNGQPFKSPPPLLPSMAPNQKPGILGSKPQPLLKSPKIPPLIPSMQPNPGLLQIPHHHQPSWSGQYDGWGGGTRKRHNEGVGGRRGGRWEDGGAWGGDGMHQKRKKWKMPEEAVAKKSTSTAPPSSEPLFSCFPRDSLACGSLEVQRRYPHLHLPSALFHMQLCWTESFPPSQPLPLCGPCLFHVGSSQPQTQATAPESTASGFSVKVMLLSMPGTEDFYTQCCNLRQDPQGTQGDAVHPTTLIKFLLAESAGELQLLGGRWSSQLDGSNPAKDLTTLIRTAVRCVEEQTGLDLQACSQWHKMAELRYLSGEKVETVLFLLPDVWNIVPTEKEWVSLRAEGKKEDKGSPLPEAPSLVVHPCSGLNLSTLSLFSLLETRNSQTMEAFEVGLMGELFSEMLQRDFGLQLYHCLCSLPLVPASSRSKARGDESEDSSTPTEDEPTKMDKQKRRPGVKDGKRRRGCREREEERGKEVKEEEMDEGEGSENQTEDKKGRKSRTVGEEGVTGDVSDNHSTKDSDRPQGWSVVLPRRVLLSWVFFDRQLVGILREQDLQNILLSLGLYLTAAQAQDLVRKATIGGQCQYRKLCSQWEDPDHLDSDFSAQGNRPLLPGQPPKERASSRRSAGSSGAEVVSYKGTILNIPNLLQSVERGKATQHELEQRITSLQAKLAEAESWQGAQQQQQGEQEELRSRLETAERRNRAYERSLKENAGHMIAVIEKMQKMVDQTTSLTGSKADEEDKE